MTKLTGCRCDHCGKEDEGPHNRAGKRGVLLPKGWTSMDMRQVRPDGRAEAYPQWHFCSLECIRGWADARVLELNREIGHREGQKFAAQADTQNEPAEFKSESLKVGEWPEANPHVAPTAAHRPDKMGYGWRLWKKLG